MKLDITKLEGYRSDMTPEQKLALYEKAEFDLSGFVPKSTADKYASEAAEFRKKYNETLSEQERKEAEKAEADKKRQDEFDKLRREVDVTKHKAKFLELGFEAKLAAETAEALFDGKMDVVFANQAKHQEAMKSAMKAELLKTTPTPPGGTGPIDANAYAKKAEDAMAAGDFAAGAYYTRLAQTQTTQGGT